MPMYDYICPDCGNHFERFFHPTQSAPNTLSCAQLGELMQCAGMAQLTFEPSIALRRPSSFAQPFTPVVIHRGADGKLRFPGHSHAPVPAGYSRVELTTVEQVRALEREVNRQENSRAENNRHAQREVSERERSQRREAFKQLAGRFSPRGRQFAEAMMYARDKRTGRLDRPHGDVNFHVDAFSMDSSNRERHSDKETGWRGRKD